MTEDLNKTVKSQPVMELDAVLAIMDTASANLERLQAVWNQALPLLPSGPQSGSTNQSDDLVRSWNDLLRGLLPIDGWRLLTRSRTWMTSTAHQ